MPGTVTASFSPNTCSHHSVQVNLDGETIDLGIVTDATLDDLPWGPAEKKVWLLGCARRKRAQGLSVAQMLGRVLAGDEATNVKTYDFLGPGNAVTKTNIGTAYTNVLPGANGERILVDCTGCTQFRPVLTANLVGTGAFGVRIVRDNDNTVFYENANIALTGERELDPGWQSLPVWATGLEVLRLQAKSAVAADDPVFRRCVLLVK